MYRIKITTNYGLFWWTGANFSAKRDDAKIFTDRNEVEAAREKLQRENPTWFVQWKYDFPA